MRNFQVIIPYDLDPYPTEDAISAASIAANYLKRDATFAPQPPHQTSLDLQIANAPWELVHPADDTELSLKASLDAASAYAPNIILDLRHTKVHAARSTYWTKCHLFESASIKHLILIQKSGKAIALK